MRADGNGDLDPNVVAAHLKDIQESLTWDKSEAKAGPILDRINTNILSKAIALIEQAKTVQSLEDKLLDLNDQVSGLNEKLRQARDRENAHAGMVTGSRDMAAAFAEGLARGFR